MKARSQEILTSIEAIPVRIGERAHALASDCDLHVPLRSTQIRVPVVAELKNACSIPKGVKATYWTEKLRPFEGRPMKAEGVFRVWLEHPPGDEGERQCECEELSIYTSSNPDHMVELHPLTRLGNISFLAHIKAVEKGGKTYQGSQGKRLAATLEKKKITIERERENGETYIVIRGPKTGFNHWTLDAVVREAPRKQKDGHYFSVDVVSRNRVVKARLPAFTISGTDADQVIATANIGDRVTLFGLMRLDLKRILQLVRESEREIRMPYEMAVLSVQRR